MSIWESGASSGDVAGPGSSTDNAVPRFDGTTGKILQGSSIIIDDTDNITGAVSISATTFSGDLSGTINTATTGATQTPGDNSTKIATTAYVDTAIGSVNSWDEVMHLGNTFTIADTENLSATITQNDVTNNPAALVIANTGSGNDITAPNFSLINGVITGISLNLTADINQLILNSDDGSGYTLTLTGTATGSAKTITLPNLTGTVALTANNLGVFAATTSAQLAGVISDETGTGVLVFDTAPTFTTSITVTGGGIIDADGIDLDTGNDYQINNTSVLNATTLGSAVVTSSLTTVGALNSGSITSGFGSIDTGASNIITTGIIGASGAALANGVTATTQSASDNSTKIATTAYVDAAAGAGSRPHEDVTGDDTITAAEMLAGKIFINKGASGAVNLTLPAGATGHYAKFIVVEAQYLRFTADGSETFRHKADQSAAGGYVRSNVVGNIIEIEWNGDEWLVTSIEGVWKYDE